MTFAFFLSTEGHKDSPFDKNDLRLELKGNLAMREPLHLGGTGMSSNDLPAVLKLLKVQGGITHQLLLGGGK
jgi:hypothetical protein